MSAPTPAQVRAQREHAGWDKRTAAAAVMVSLRAWQAWEAGTRKMPPSTWLLFRLMAGTTDRTYNTPRGRATLRLVVDTSNRPATE